MPTVMKTLRRLTDVDVSHVSLVDRGANRIPFRIVKRDDNPQENSMLNLLNLRKRAAPTTPTPTAFVVKAEGLSDEMLASIQKGLQDAGFDFKVIQKVDDNVVFAEDENFSKDTHAVELEKDTAVILKSFEPYSTSLNEMSFSEAAQARGFYSSLRSAAEVYVDAVNSRLYASKTPGEATSEIKKLSTEFASYATTLCAALPAKVFKFEEILKAAKPAAKDENKEDPKEDDEAAKAATKKEDETPAPVVEADPVVVPGTDPAPVAEPAAVEKADPTPSPQLEELLKAVGALAAQMTDMASVVKSTQEQVQTIQKSQADLKTEVDTVTRKADDSARVLKGTVLGSDAGGEPTPQTPVKKSSDPLSGCFDTAYIRRR